MDSCTLEVHGLLNDDNWVQYWVHQYSVDRLWLEIGEWVITVFPVGCVIGCVADYRAGWLSKTFMRCIMSIRRPERNMELLKL